MGKERFEHPFAVHEQLLSVPMVLPKAHVDVCRYVYRMQNIRLVSLLMLLLELMC